MAYLLCQEHAEAPRVGEHVDLVFPSTVIGRGVLADIRIREKRLPRKLLELRRVETGHYAAVPLNGGRASVNDKPLVTRMILQEGDRIRAGNAVFEFHQGGPEGPNASQPPDAPRSSPIGGMLKLIFGTFVSRIFGLAREVVGAAYFGAGASMDVFFTAFTVPNLFRRVFGEMAMESAFLPPFQTYLARGRPQEAWRLASTICNLLALSLAGVVLFLYLLAPQVVAMIAPGYGPELTAQTVHLTRLMMPFTLLVGLAAFLGSLLLARKRYAAYSLAPTLFSAGEILGVALFYDSLGLYSLGVGVLLGGAGQVAVQCHGFRHSRKQEGGYQTVLDWKHPGLRKFVSLMGPIFLTSVVDKLGEVTKRIITSFLVAGSLSALTYAFRLVQLPFSIIGLALSRAILPFLAEKIASNDLKDFRGHLVRGLNLCSFLMVPTAVGVAILSVPLVETIFAYGAWSRTNPEATSMTALALVVYAISLPFMSAGGILVRAFHAMLDTRSPLSAAVRGLYVNIILTLCLGVTSMAHAGLALALTLDYVLQSWLLMRALQRTLSASGESFGLRPIFEPLLPIGLASAAMGVVLGCCRFAVWPGTAAGPLLRVIALGFLIGVGMAVYGLFAWLLRVPEMQRAVARLRAALSHGVS